MIDLDMFGTAPTEVAPGTLAECPAPGVYYGIPSADYHKWPAISSTLLKSYAKLPSTARIPFEPGDDANVGSGIHAYSLQGQDGLVAECFILPSSCEGKSKKALEEREYYQGLHPGKAMLPSVYGPEKIDISDVLDGVDNSLNDHPKVGPVLRESQKEVSVVWIDPDTECICKARFDIWDGSIIWDLKKTRSIGGFRWQMKDLHYGIQAGFYYEGAIACSLPAVGFGFIPVEATPPYQCGCGYVDPDRLETERANARRLIGLVKQSQLTGRWPNFPIPDHIFDLDDIQPDDLMEVW